MKFRIINHMGFTIARFIYEDDRDCCLAALCKENKDEKFELRDDD